MQHCPRYMQKHVMGTAADVVVAVSSWLLPSVLSTNTCPQALTCAIQLSILGGLQQGILLHSLHAFLMTLDYPVQCKPVQHGVLLYLHALGTLKCPGDIYPV